MRKIVVGAFTSLDGVMQAPGGPEEDPTGGFGFGGWVAPHFDEDMGAFVEEMFAEPFDLLLGRKTYDIFAAHWPYAPPDDPIRQRFDRIRKHVASRNAGLKLDWQNSHWLGAETVAAIRTLKATDGPNLLTQGSTVLLATLFAEGLVDELYVSVLPVVLGRGKRLFGDTSHPTEMALGASRTSSTGVVMNRYVRGGAVRTGSFEFEQPTAAELERRRNLT